MTEKKCIARLRVITPLGIYTCKGDEINDTKIAFQDYVEEVTSLIVHGLEGNVGGVPNFTDEEGKVVFIMPGTMKNSVVTVEKVG